MPNVSIVLPNVDESVFRPLIGDLTQQIQELTNLNFVKDIRFLNYNGTVQTYDSAVTDPKARYASFTGQNRIWVEAEEDYNPEGWATSIIERNEHVPLFVDSKLGVNIAPILVPSNVTVKFKFTTNSRDEARKWRDDIAMRLAQMRDGYQHTLTFNINLPISLWNLVADVWEAREKVKGYGQTLDEYIKQHSDNDLTIVSNALGHHRSFAFRRRLARINGRFDISPLPEKPVYNDSGGIWECSIAYKFTYDRPLGCRARYPIMVHNQFMPDKYIVDTNHNQNMNDKHKKLGQTMGYFSQFESYAINGYNCHQDAYIHIPSIDDYTYRTVPKGTATVLLALLRLEKETPHTLLNLSDLDDNLIDEDILNFIREVEHPWLNKPYTSFFGLQFYRDKDLMRSSTIQCDARLNVTPTENLSLRDIYRVRLCLVVDPTLLPVSAFERLRNYPVVLVKVVAAINDALRYNVDFQGLGNQRTIYDWQFSKLWQLLNGVIPMSPISLGRGLDNFKSRDTMKIPPSAYKLLKNTPQMRTVQLRGLIVHNR